MDQHGVESRGMPALRAAGRSFVKVGEAKAKNAEGGARDAPTITIVAWNVLADKLCQSQFGWHEDAEVYEWKSRSALITEEIRSAAADVLLLSEVNRSKFKSFFLRAHPEYEGRFFPKRLRVPLDGCAILWKRSTCRRVAQRTIPYGEFAKSSGRTCPHVAGLVHLQHIDTGRDFLAICTHWKSGGSKADGQLRGIQAAALVSQLHRIVAAMGLGPQTLVFVGGDFNESLGSAGVSHLLDACHLVSVYGRDSPPTAIDASPHRKNVWMDSVDHLLYSKAAAVEAVWPIPSVEEFGSRGIPSATYPSDHIAIGAVFTLFEAEQVAHQDPRPTAPSSCVVADDETSEWSPWCTIL